MVEFPLSVTFTSFIKPEDESILLSVRQLPTGTYCLHFNSFGEQQINIKFPTLYLILTLLVTCLSSKVKITD